MSVLKSCPGEYVLWKESRGLYVYEFENVHPKSFDGKPHPKIGVLSVTKSGPTSFIPSYIKGAANQHKIFLDLPEIPMLCAALMRAYDKYLVEFQTKTGVAPPEITNKARATVEAVTEKIEENREAKELEAFAAGLSDFSTKKPVIRRGPQRSDDEKMIEEMEKKGL